MSKKKTIFYRDVYCPDQGKVYVIDENEKCCPCCGKELSDPEHDLYEEVVSEND